MSRDYPDPGDILAIAATYGGQLFLTLEGYESLVSGWGSRLAYSNPADGPVRPLVQGVKIGFVSANVAEVEKLVEAGRMERDWKKMYEEEVAKKETDAIVFRTMQAQIKDAESATMRERGQAEQMFLIVKQQSKAIENLSVVLGKMSADITKLAYLGDNR